ncbi:MAG: hypothetical protein MUF01_07105 [Bryobacterales bacterium]|nr:hypothetical protein [Bryobacterales bacterium]
MTKWFSLWKYIVAAYTWAMGIRVESDLDSALREKWLRHETDLESFIRQFRACTLPQREWTHRAHVGVAAALILSLGSDEALRVLRATIPRLNESYGGVNTPTSGYHDTLTVFWVRLVATLLSRLPQQLSHVDRVAIAVEAYGDLRRADRAFYEGDLMHHEEARTRWVPPSRGPSWLMGTR